LRSFYKKYKKNKKCVLLKLSILNPAIMDAIQTRIYWETAENTYLEVFTSKKYFV
jgi:hypothetical protein